MQQQQQQAPTINIQNLYWMYNQNPAFSNPNNKYAALDALGNFGQPNMMGGGGMYGGNQGAMGGMGMNMGGYPQ